MEFLPVWALEPPAAREGVGSRRIVSHNRLVAQKRRGQKGKKSRAKRSRQPGGARRASTLSAHVRDSKRRELVPPLLAAMQGKHRALAWERDLLPEMLWTASLLVEEWPDRGEHHAALSRLDDLVPDGREVLNGTISSFALVPADRRPEARRWLADTKALTDDFANALSLYSECPAGWMVEDWLQDHTPDSETGVEYLRKLVLRMRDGYSSYAAQLRWVLLARMAKNRKLTLTAEMVDLMKRYPRSLDDDERAKVESLIRASTLSMVSLPGAPNGTSGWTRAFWRQNRTLSPCERSAPLALTDEDEPELDLDTEAPKLLTSAVSTGFVDSVEGLERNLRGLQDQVELDLYEPVTDEVKMGLASRQVRLLRRFVEQPSGWTTERSAHALRPMVDTRILAAWLVDKNDPELFERYKSFGQGKLKLLKLNFEDHIEKRGATEPTHDEYLAWLDARVNEEVMEEYQTISLAPSFADRSIFKMAEDVGLKDLYDLVYAPLSGESHGDWGSLRLHDLDRCANPLHRYHRLGRFGEREETVTLDYVFTVVALVSETVELIFDSYRIPTEDVLDRFRNKFFAVLDSVSDEARHSPY